MPTPNLATPPSPDVTPLERDGLVALFQAPGKTLARNGRGFVAAPAYRTSGPTLVHAISRRMANRLEAFGLVTFDDPHCPSTLTLTAAGAELVAALLANAPKAPTDRAEPQRRGETSPWRRTNACVTRKAMQSAAQIRRNARERQS